MADDARHDEAPHEARPQSAPVSFSQLAQWNRENLAERPGARSIASATRLSGRLSFNALRKSIYEVVQRHDALRTRIPVRNGGPIQEIRDVPEEMCLTRAPASAAGIDPPEAILGVIRNLMVAPVDVRMGPLFAMQLLELGETEHVLVMTMEHLISDNVSKEILLQDVLAAYAQLSTDRVVSWNRGTLQFSDYARLQSRRHASWLKTHGAYWERRMLGCARTKFPKRSHTSANSRIGWGTAPIHIDPQLETRLRRWCRANSTTVPMVVFAAYVALVLRWCDIEETVVQFQSHGRLTAGAENAIGSYAGSLYLRLGWRKSDDFLALLDRVTQEFCGAYEHQDFSYLAAQTPPPPYTRNCVFNWIPAAPPRPIAESHDSTASVIASSLSFPNPWLENLTWDNEPTTVLFESAAGITGSVHFASSTHTADEMQGFVRAFLSSLDRMTTSPRTRVDELLLAALEDGEQ